MMQSAGVRNALSRAGTSALSTASKQMKMPARRIDVLSCGTLIFVSRVRILRVLSPEHHRFFQPTAHLHQKAQGWQAVSRFRKHQAFSARF